MMYQGYGMGAGNWLIMALIVLGAVGLIWAVTVAVVRSSASQRRPEVEDAGKAEGVLADRFAHGEIDSEEYEARLRVLRAQRR
jgi:putative membrane protein